MPIIKSAKKRVRVASKATARNNKTKRAFRAAVKQFHAKTSDSAHRKAQSALDKAAKKGLMHKNKIARKKSQLAKLAKAAGVKPTKVAKSAVKKPVAKKTSAKKPATKKSAKKS